MADSLRQRLLRAQPPDISAERVECGSKTVEDAERARDTQCGLEPRTITGLEFDHHASRDISSLSNLRDGEIS